MTRAREPGLDAGRLRALTLARQFPAVGRPDSSPTGADLVELVGRVGPVQSQVPRSPFLVASSRLPGIDHATVSAAFAGHRLLKTSSLRGTVHTTVRTQYPWVDAVSRVGRTTQLRRLLGLTAEQSAELFGELEAFAAEDWRDRSAVVEHGRAWLARHHPAGAAAALDQPAAAGAVWSHSGLIRRPYDDRWERRTDTRHRTARALFADEHGDNPAEDRLPAPVDLPTAVRELVVVHLSAFGPATEVDLAWWLGLPRTPVRRALAELGDLVVALTGPQNEPLLDLSGPDGTRWGSTRADQTAVADPGLRLLPEFDSLTLGYHADGRDRFVRREDLGRIWSKTNGVCQPAVLYRQRLVATWRQVATSAGRVRIEITPFRSGLTLPADELARRAADTARVLGLVLADVAVLPAL